ncbi:hypothetical protein GHT09_003088 [Marmota monax]|uniref:Uncharacterized protein n=1 Tax=Marmota monax TaxID=9995 RepID=A0A834QTM7_MARMO|nr:hypothetical protein GHT09_003088 [Marmota monax]
MEKKIWPEIMEMGTDLGSHLLVLFDSRTGSLDDRGRRDICAVQGKLKFESTTMMVLEATLFSCHLAS